MKLTLNEIQACLELWFPKHQVKIRARNREISGIEIIRLADQKAFYKKRQAFCWDWEPYGKGFNGIIRLAKDIKLPLKKVFLVVSYRNGRPKSKAKEKHRYVMSFADLIQLRKEGKIAIELEAGKNQIIIPVKLFVDLKEGSGRKQRKASSA